MFLAALQPPLEGSSARGHSWKNPWVQEWRDEGIPVLPSHPNLFSLAQSFPTFSHHDACIKVIFVENKVNWRVAPRAGRWSQGFWLPQAPPDGSQDCGKLYLGALQPREDKESTAQNTGVEVGKGKPEPLGPGKFWALIGLGLSGPNSVRQGRKDHPD